METNKSILILWSGGADSTYLVEKTIDSGLYDKVHTGYIELKNNEDKTKAELDAIEKIKPRFEKSKCYNHLGLLSSYHSHRSGFISNSQMPVWILSSLFVASCYDEIAISYVMNDCGISDIENLKKLWNSASFFFNNGIPYEENKKYAELVFPLKYTQKSRIYECINEVEIFKKNIWVCEHPIKNYKKFKPCNECKPCKRKLL